MSVAYEGVIQLYTEGHTAEEIRSALGLTRSTVESYLCKAQREKRLVLRPKGRPRSVWQMLPAEVRKWLFSVTPSGASVEETMRAIIVDAYNEERE